MGNGHAADIAGHFRRCSPDTSAFNIWEQRRQEIDHQIVLAGGEEKKKENIVSSAIKRNFCVSCSYAAKLMLAGWEVYGWNEHNSWAYEER